MDGKADSKITVVLARNFREFHFWCQENEVSPRDPSVIYASEMSRILGLGNIRVVTYGTWFHRRDAYEMLIYLRTVESRYATSEG
jgi:hypothetical protein